MTDNEPPETLTYEVLLTHEPHPDGVTVRLYVNEEKRAEITATREEAEAVGKDLLAKHGRRMVMAFGGNDDPDPSRPDWYL
jgi:hypothetical protein